MFIDEVRISVKAGGGGNGCMAFRREKFVPRGGPSGGDGGRGGDITMVASGHRNTLLQYRFNPEHAAQRGRHGEGSNRTGHEGRFGVVTKSQAITNAGRNREHVFQSTGEFHTDDVAIRVDPKSICREQRLSKFGEWLIRTGDDDARG